ncbi:hypothetical protein NL676_014864 [Syzygium grande]|nr:hypothetical protein NL676_014864 [Syzygium grande]
MAAVKFANMAVVAFVLIPMVLAVTAQVEPLAPSPTSLASSVSPSILFARAAAFTALVFAEEADEGFRSSECGFAARGLGDFFLDSAATLIFP